MSIFDAIQRAQSIADELAHQPEQLELSKRLKSELNAILGYAKQKNTLAETSHTAQPQAKRDPNSGCYRFEGDQGYYCPSCYERDNSRTATQRINSKLRVCPQCRSSIKPAKGP